MYEDLDIFKELCLCYPLWLLEFKEMNAVIAASDKMLTDAKTAVSRLIENQFITKADEKRIGELEQFLGISVINARGMKERRDFVSSQFVGNGTFGIDKIKEIVSIFTKSPCNVRLNSSSDIDVEIMRDINDSFVLDDCIEMLNKRKPAHVKISVRLQTPFNVLGYIAFDVSEYKFEKIM